MIQRWRRCATSVCVLLVVVHLPLALLFSLQARMYYQTFWELTKDSALLIVVYAALSVLMGLLVAVAAAAVQPFSRKRADELVALSELGFAFLMLVSSQPFIQKWWWQTQVRLLRTGQFEGSVNIVPWLIGGVLLFALYFVWRRGVIATGDALSRSLHNGAPLTYGVVGASLLLSIVTGHIYWRGFGWESAPARPAARADAPDVYLITIDTLAAGDMSLHGFKLPTTPAFERFAKQSYVFDNFIANSNYTTPTVASILTGRHPVSHTVYQHYAGVLPAQRELNLAALLRAQGYTTAAVVSNPMAHPINLKLSESFDYISDIASNVPGHALFGVFGFERADLAPFLWDWWLGPAVREIVPWIPLRSIQKDSWYPPALVIDQAREVRSQKDGPMFLWTHFFAPHEPYLVPKPWQGRYLPGDELDSLYDLMQGSPVTGLYAPGRQPLVDKMRLRYDEEVNYADDGLAAYLEALEKSGALDNAIVIITADHGESFENGWRGHSGPMLYQPLIHVPLLVKLPGEPGGKRVASNAQQVDILPTVLDAMGLEKPAWSEGESLIPAIRDGHESAQTKFAVAVDRSPRFLPLTNGTVAAIQGPHKLIRYLGSGCEELYDLRADPGENNNLAPTLPQVATSLRAEIERHIRVPVPAGPNPDADCRRPWLDRG